MLRLLHIRDFALIREAHLELGEGLTVLSGETGAGKSLVLDALGLLAGMRGSPSLVRSGAKRAAVEALFEVPPGAPIGGFLEENGLEGEAGEVILRREILASGRGRASVNGRLVPVAMLERVAAHLFEIGSQHEQFALLKGECQQELFDGFRGLQPLVERFREALQRALKARGRLEDRRGADAGRRQRRDFLAFQMEEIEAAAPTPGELEKIGAEISRLSHVETLLEEGAEAGTLIFGDEAGQAGARDLLGRALQNVRRMVAHDGGMEPIGELLDQASDLVAEAGFRLNAYLERLERDPSRLEAAREREDLLRRLLRKHGATEEELLGRLEEMRAEFEELEGWEADEGRLAREAAEASREALARAGDLSAARRKAVAGFVRPLTAMLKDFALPKVRIGVEMTPPSSGFEAEAGVFLDSRGAEHLEILFSANEGEALQPLRRIGSGGELSRVMLALRALAGEASRIPLFVFDEVDAGISGQAARHVGARLAALGRNAQVIAVSHNPSVASHGDHHFLVEKRQDGGRTISEVLALDGRARREELARLLDGGKISAKGLALAEELLERTA